MKIDILPDINKPTVTVFAESPGMAPEDVERLILNPIEAVLLGTPGVDRIRSNASYAQATVNVEFAWGSDILRNRQVVQERLAQTILPAGVKPVLGPSTSLLGEIMWVGLSANDSSITPMQLRTLADSTVRPALLKTPGVANVLVMGGDVREWQINVNALRMRHLGIMFSDIRASVEDALTNKSGGVIVDGETEYPIRIMTAPAEIGELGQIAIESSGGQGVMGNGRVIRLADIATIVEGPSPVRGSGAINGSSGVILRIVRQPDAETLRVTDMVAATLRTLSASLPRGVEIHPELFRQETFIRAGLGNVAQALRDGTILVVIVLIIFLMNVRTTFITLTAIPLSILITAIVFKQFGLSVNVMTLGGIAVAVGELVDDAIVGVENIFRRLRLWNLGGKKENREQVVLFASSEVRNSIVYATALVAVVFLPIFFVPDLDGRLLTSLGAAYLISLVASMLVSLTVTPALSALLLKENALRGHERETGLVRWIKRGIAPRIMWCVLNTKLIVGMTTIALVLSVGSYFFAGKEGIPPFNEGSAVVMLFLPPGTALATTDAYVAKLEKSLLAISGVREVSHIAGRAVADPHGGSANTSEIQIAFASGYFEHDRERLFREIQEALDRVGDADYSLGQPITHRVEMLLSGVRAPIVVKVFGDNTEDMQRGATIVLDALKKQKGITNPRIQQNTVVPELRVYVDRNRVAEYGLSSGEVGDDLEMGLMGDTLGAVRLGGVSVPVVVRFDSESKGSFSALRDIALPWRGGESLGAIGDMRIEGGQNNIDHEGGKRVLVVSANYQGRDIVGTVGATKVALESSSLPVGVTLSFEGTYKSQKESTRRLALVFLVGIVLIFLVLYHAFRSSAVALLVMANIPTVMVGGMIGVWATGGEVNLAHLVGFISLAGIVSRNGIMLIGRTLTLVGVEKKGFSPETMVEATLDRVVPVLMTSLVTALALIPLILSGGSPGKEMLHPLAVVIFGGLVSSTAISLFITPALFYRFGKKVVPDKAEFSGF